MDSRMIPIRALRIKNDTILEENNTHNVEKGDVRTIEEIEPLQEPRRSAASKVRFWCSERCCTINLLKRRIPIVSWLPQYSVEDLKGDIVAGATVALTVIPQGLALALLAGLPPQFGLYTAFMGCFVYTIFGSCKDLTIGPTAIMSLMTAESVAGGGVVYSILITFLSGCIMLAMGLLNLGVLVTFISSAVVSGFTSAAAITIATTQLAGIFGLKFKSEGFIQDVYHFFSAIKNDGIRYWDMTMGLSCIVFLLIINHFREIKFVSCLPTQLAKAFESLWWTIATARNALLVLLCTGIAAILIAHDIKVLELTQEVEAGLPPFKLPQFSYSFLDNKTNQTVHKDFTHIVQDLGSGLVVIPLLCILEAIAIAKSFAKGKKLDATQEMIALGLCNIMGSFVSSYPATGSFSRTAINYSSGVRTPAGGIVTGGLVLLALGVMSPYFRYIPKASLSALIFVAVLNMVHYKDVIIMWRTNKLDLVPFFATFIFSFVLGLEYGIIIGIGISLILLLLQEAKPKIAIEEKKTFLGNTYLYIKPDRTVLFPSTEYLQSKIVKSVPARQHDEMYAVLLDGDHIMTADYTMALGMKNLINNFKKENVYVIFCNLRVNVQRIIKGASETEFIHFMAKEDAENFIDALFLSNRSPPYDTGLTEQNGSGDKPITADCD